MVCSWLDFQEFEGCQKLRCRKAKRSVDEADVGDFVRVGDVLAVPRGEYITAVEGSESKAVGVPSAFQRHDLVAEVNGYDGVDFVRVGQAGEWV